METVNILYSRSAYGNDKKHMSKTKDDVFKYPVVYSIYQNDTPNLMYSNTNKYEHFIPKVIWGNGGNRDNMGIIVDKTGEYGLSNFTYGIVDEVENLDKIKIALQSNKFMKIALAISFGEKSHINHKIMALFRKDFYKYYI